MSNNVRSNQFVISNSVKFLDENVPTRGFRVSIFGITVPGMPCFFLQFERSLTQVLWNTWEKNNKITFRNELNSGEWNESMEYKTDSQPP